MIRSESWGVAPGLYERALLALENNFARTAADALWRARGSEPVIGTASDTDALQRFAHRFDWRFTFEPKFERECALMQ
jgi:hypothetical protein